MFPSIYCLLQLLLLLLPMIMMMILVYGWLGLGLGLGLGGVTDRASHLRSSGHGFDSRSDRYHAT